jgi:hypothetical protein
MVVWSLAVAWEREDIFLVGLRIVRQVDLLSELTFDGRIE